MIRNLVLGVLFTGLIGVLIFGAVNRTIAKSETPLAFGLNRDTQVEEGMVNEEGAMNEGYGRGGTGQGRNSADNDANRDIAESANPLALGINRETQIEESMVNEEVAMNEGYGRGGTGQGRNTSDINANRTYPLAVSSIEGRVESVTNEALVVITQDGNTVVVEGRPWRFVQEMGYTLQVNEQVRITGFNEDGEFKVVTLTRVGGGEAFQLRDESSGRPFWAGDGNGANLNNT